MVNVTNGTNVNMWFGTLKFTFSHNLFPLLYNFKKL